MVVEKNVRITERFFDNLYKVIRNRSVVLAFVRVGSLPEFAGVRQNAGARMNRIQEALSYKGLNPESTKS